MRTRTTVFRRGRNFGISSSTSDPYFGYNIHVAGDTLPVALFFCVEETPERANDWARFEIAPNH